MRVVRNYGRIYRIIQEGGAMQISPLLTRPTSTDGDGVFGRLLLGDIVLECLWGNEGGRSFLSPIADGVASS